MGNPTFCLLSGEAVDLDSVALDGSVEDARKHLAAALQLPFERVELVVGEQVVLADSDKLPDLSAPENGRVIQVCIRPDPLEEKLPDLLGCAKWSELEILKEVDLQESGLELLPDIFGEKLPRLKTLRLSQNRLRLLPRSFGELRKLQALQAEACSIAGEDATRSQAVANQLNALQMMSPESHKLTGYCLA
eukprot:Skav209561  [mRNA]  locus=scaffold2497:666211:673553:+ [translate_table: standard]